MVRAMACFAAFCISSTVLAQSELQDRLATLEKKCAELEKQYQLVLQRLIQVEGELKRLKSQSGGVASTEEEGDSPSHKLPEKASADEQADRRKTALLRKGYVDDGDGILHLFSVDMTNLGQFRLQGEVVNLNGTALPQVLYAFEFVSTVDDEVIWSSTFGVQGVPARGSKRIDERFGTEGLSCKTCGGKGYVESRGAAVERHSGQVGDQGYHGGTVSQSLKRTECTACGAKGLDVRIQSGQYTLRVRRR